MFDVLETSRKRLLDAYHVGEPTIEEKRVMNYYLDEICANWRFCWECGDIIYEGYYYGNDEYCCSDECGAKHDGVTVEEFRKEIDDAVESGDFEDWQIGFWTTCE